MLQIYSERQFSQAHRETEYEYFMRMASGMRDQRRRRHQRGG